MRKGGMDLGADYCYDMQVVCLWLCSQVAHNGITYTRGRFARAACLMRGLGSAVAADKREVLVLTMKYYYYSF